MSLFLEVAEVAAEAAWQHRSDLRNKLVRFWNRVRHGHLKVVVFGLGGAGKTTLGKLLSGVDEDELPRGYEESLQAETFALDGDLSCSLFVAPGQERRESEEPRERLNGVLSTGEGVGVINVVAYGYHHFAQLGYTRHKLYQAGMSPEQFMAAYVVERRDAEIKALERMKPFLVAARPNVWMVTLVTKQDLWWGERHAVEAHYEDEKNAYAGIIAEVTRQRHPRYFLHRTVSASLVWNNLRDPEEVVLATTTAGYEQNVRKANLRRALAAIHGIAEQQVKT
jgi:hypothetical protein